MKDSFTLRPEVRFVVRFEVFDREGECFIEVIVFHPAFFQKPPMRRDPIAVRPAMSGIVTGNIVMEVAADLHQPDHESEHFAFERLEVHDDVGRVVEPNRVAS